MYYVSIEAGKSEYTGEAHRKGLYDTAWWHNIKVTEDCSGFTRVYRHYLKTHHPEVEPARERMKGK